MALLVTMNFNLPISADAKDFWAAWRPRLRLFRTLFVNRWHAAVTVGEVQNNPNIGERAEHINHAASLSEYLWRFGAFKENLQGTGRIDVNDIPSLENGLKHAFDQLKPYDEKLVRTAVHYAIWKHGRSQEEPEEMENLINKEVNEFPFDVQNKIKSFAEELKRLQNSMIEFYLDMFYHPYSSTDQLAIPRNYPVTSAIYSTDISSTESISTGIDVFPVQGDPILAVQNAFSRNIYNALCWRARHELAKSGALVPWKPGAEFRTGAIVNGRFGIYTTDDEALQSMLTSLSEPAFPLVVQLCCSIKRAVSTMITALPMFIVRNFFRDTLAAFVLGRHAQTPVVGTVKGATTAVEDLRSGNSG